MGLLDLTKGGESSLFFYNSKIKFTLTLKKVMKFYDILRDDRHSETSKIDYALFVLLDNVVDGDIRLKEELLIKIFKEEIDLSCYSDDVEYDINGNVIEKIANDDYDNEQFFSFTQDFDFIYADFLREYRINLLSEDVGWKEFNALLSSLSEDSKLQRVIRIRKWQPNKTSSQEEIEEYKKLKEHYKLRKEV